MKTFAEAFAARGLDDWDVQQAIKRLQQARRRDLARPDPRGYPNAADLADYRKRGLAGPALAAAYVATFDRLNNLLPQPAPAAVAPAPTLAQAAAPAPATAPAATHRPTRHRQGPAPRRADPLRNLLAAVHDAHLAAREGLRAARRHITTA